MASEAEKRIRDKAEALMRSTWPSGRIVHEFDLGGARLDLACILPDRLILGEVKSERDTLDRLHGQMRHACAIGGPVLLFCAERWVGHRVDIPWSVLQLVETGDGFVRFVGANHRRPLEAHMHHQMHDRWCPRSLLKLLLKPELLALARPHGGRSRYDVASLQNIAMDGLTGRELRHGVMAALRARRFGWTCDKPIEVL
nr:hypothetical protein [Brevundimonas naejangsanensis]